MYIAWSQKRTAQCGCAVSIVSGVCTLLDVLSSILGSDDLHRYHWKTVLFNIFFIIGETKQFYLIVIALGYTFSKILVVDFPPGCRSCLMWFLIKPWLKTLSRHVSRGCELASPPAKFTNYSQPSAKYSNIWSRVSNNILFTADFRSMLVICEKI